MPGREMVMEKFSKTKLHRKLRAEHRKHHEERPLLYLGAVLLICLILSLITYHVKPLYSYEICYYIFVVGAVSGTLVFLVSYFARRRSLNKTAQSVDQEHGAKSRLEAAVELDKAGHPLQTLQRQDTEEFYSGHSFSYWNTARLILVTVLLLLSGVNFKILEDQQQRYQEAAQKAKEKKPEKKETPKKPKPKDPQDKAELKLIMPEAEIRAKPLDEIEWAGVGRSTRGFRQLVLSIYVNGKFVKDILPEETPSRKAGNIKTGGFFALDEFDVQPFDLVSYHLTGYSQINADQNRRIISSPQFIEVRPFREDAFFGKDGGGNGENERMLNILLRFLRLQIVLNKATFTARIMREQGNREELEKYAKFLQTVKKEQVSLNEEVEAFLNSQEARKFPAEAIDNVEKAAREINAACGELENLTRGYKK